MARGHGRISAGEEVTKGDAIVEKGAERLEDLSTRAAEAGGLRARLASELADDAAFLRKLKPSLIAARAKGELPTDEEPGSEAAGLPPPKPKKRRSGQGPNAVALVAAAFALGIALAKLIDWRSHAHPRS
jgi:hypothetical protein